MQDLPHDILDRITGEFSEFESRRVIKLLSAYYGPERDRVVRCILHLSEGSIERISLNTGTANIDYRDIIYFAEYDGDDRQLHDFRKPFK